MEHPARGPWPHAFPEVVVHCPLAARDAHPSYAAAKAGSAQDALALVEALMSPAATDELRAVIGGNRPVLLPVVADEMQGFNAIPDAMAMWLYFRLDAACVESGRVVQTNKVGHTRAPAFQRFVTPATFDGPVRHSMDYVLIDDHVGFGGTLANLRGHVEANGGRVIAMTALTESPQSRVVALRPETLDVLRKRHGEDLEHLWRDQFGHGLDGLTEREARQLCRLESVAAIQDLLAQAAVEARGRGLSAAFRREE